MRATLIIASLFAAFAVAAPIVSDAPAIEAVEVEARQSPRVILQLSNPTTAVQGIIPTNQRISIKSRFGNLGAQITADRANIVGKGGPCTVFRDADARIPVATVQAGGAVFLFQRKVDLVNGVVVCQ